MGGALGVAIWLHRLIRHHGRPRAASRAWSAPAASVGNDGQAFLSWLAVAWVVLTLVPARRHGRGQPRVMPLTGVTFPFVSFGMTSLVVNMAILALA